jgi:hypothetical protein
MLKEPLDGQTDISFNAIYLAKHAVAMENLTDAIKQLDTLIKKVISLESLQPSCQLKEALASFVDYHINPLYYQDMNWLPVAAVPSIAPTGSSTINRVKVSNYLDQELEDLYKSALEKAFKVFN